YPIRRIMVFTICSMKKKYLFIYFLFLLVACAKKNGKDFNSDFSLYKDYITEFTSGIISAKSTIRIVLNFNTKEWMPNQELESNLVEITPMVEGKVIALSQNTLMFKPSKRLKQDTEYQISFKLKELIDVPKELKEFNFTIKTIKQDFVVLSRELQSYSSEYQFQHAILRTSDEMDAQSAAKLIYAKQGTGKLPIRFDQIKSGTEFRFIVDSIKRPEKDGS